MENKGFNEFLTEKRREKGLTIYKLAKLSGVSHSYISQLERGIKKDPSPVILKKLSEPLIVPYNELLLRAGHVTKQEYSNFKSENSQEKTTDNLANFLERQNIHYKGKTLTENKRKLLNKYLELLFGKQ